MGKSRYLDLRISWETLLFASKIVSLLPFLNHNLSVLDKSSGKQGPTNPPVTANRHAKDFGDKLSRTQFLGVQLPAGSIWKAKGQNSTCHRAHCHP